MCVGGAHLCEGGPIWVPGVSGVGPTLTPAQHTHLHTGSQSPLLCWMRLDDITEIALKKAKARCPFANFSEMNLADLKFEDGFFDVIIITEVLEHVIEYRAVVAELKRVLKKGGFLIVTFPNEFLWTVSRFLLGRRPIKVPDHVNSFNPSKIKKLIGMELITRKNLPFGGPFSFSLGGFMNFKK